MSELKETVKIVRENSRLGYRIINKSDFDASKHTLFGEELAAARVDEIVGEVDYSSMSIEELSMIAIDLGLEPKDNWSAKRLISEITKAKKG